MYLYFIGLFKSDIENDSSNQSFYDISSIPELHISSWSPNELVLGSGLSISKAISILEKTARQEDGSFDYTKIVAAHFKSRVANTHVRNVNTTYCIGNPLLQYLRVHSILKLVDPFIRNCLGTKLEFNFICYRQSANN